MKQPKRLTRSQKEMLLKKGMIPAEWAVVYDGITHVMFINKETKKLVPLYK